MPSDTIGPPIDNPALAPPATERRTQLLDSQALFEAALDEWRRVSALGVDTEANSFFVYRERTCLVQVSSADTDWILDPFAVDLAPFGEILANPAIEKIFHASEFDILSLKRDYGFTFANLYDTLIAAKAVGRKKVGLANLAEESLGLKLAKDEQRSDWGHRPLTRQQIEYAFADTRHLIALSDILKAEVLSRGSEILEEVTVDCVRVTEKVPRAKEFDPEVFEKHTSARKMDPASRQVLRSLFVAREAKAQEIDKPLFRIVGDEPLGEIALLRPTTKAELGKIRGITPPVLGRHGDWLLAAVLEGLERGPLAFQRRPFVAPDLAEEERYERLRGWRRQVAEARRVEVEVIAGNAALKAIARLNPATLEALGDVTELDAFRRAKYGEALIQAMRKKA